MSLKKIKEITLTNNRPLMIALNVLSLVLFAVALPVFTKLAALMQPVQPDVALEEISFRIDILDLVVFLVAVVAVLMIHELIHGLFFKVFAPDRPVKYGFHWYALSASSPGTKYTKGKFLWIGMAPFVLITAALTIFLALGLVNIPFYVFIASMHAAGCIGDFYFCILLLREPSDILTEDTGTGMILYQKEST